MFIQIPIPEYSDYLINESGVIMSKDGEVLRFSADQMCRLYSTINGKNVYIAELVAKTFLRQPDCFEYVNYRDNDPLNCHVSNLYWTDDSSTDNYQLYNRNNREYSNSTNTYEIFNEDESVIIECVGRGEVAMLIQYEEISLKNMVGNGRKISKGPYKGFMIRRTSGYDNQFSNIYKSKN